MFGFYGEYIGEDGELIECVECGQNITSDEDYIDLGTGEYVCEDCQSEWDDVEGGEDE